MKDLEISIAVLIYLIEKIGSSGGTLSWFSIPIRGET